MAAVGDDLAWSDEYLAMAEPGDLAPLRALAAACVERLAAIRAIYPEAAGLDYDGLAPIAYSQLTAQSALKRLQANILKMGGYYVDPRRRDLLNDGRGGPRHYSVQEIVRSDHPLMYTPRADATVTDPGAVAAYRRILGDCKHWLARYRYLDGTRRCRHTRRISRSWGWQREAETGKPLTLRVSVNGEVVDSPPSSPDSLGNDLSTIRDVAGPAWLPDDGARLSIYVDRYVVVHYYAIDDVHYEREETSWRTEQPAGVIAVNPAPMACAAALWIEGIDGQHGTHRRYEITTGRGVMTQAWPPADPTHIAADVAGHAESHTLTRIAGDYRLTSSWRLDGSDRGSWTRHEREITYDEDGGVLTDTTSAVPPWGSVYDWRDVDYAILADFGLPAAGFGIPSPPVPVPPRGSAVVVEDVAAVRSPGGELDWPVFAAATTPELGIAFPGGDRQGRAQGKGVGDCRLRVIYDYDPGYYYHGEKGDTDE